MGKSDKIIGGKISSRRMVTKITFTGDDLTALARYVSAGMVLLQTSHPIIPRIKAALTRLGLPVPKGF